MHLLCPHCQNPIELIRLTFDDIRCPSCGSTFRVESEATVTWGGERRSLGRFELIEPVGTGAFGTVYKARDPRLDRTVAIKIPRAGNLGVGDELTCFLREARPAAQLQHPAIVPIHEVGQEDSTAYIVSDFIQGVTLADLTTSCRPEPRKSARLIAEVADALQYAHDRGIVHRDVKPSNIMIGEGDRPFLMDFGLAKRDAGEVTMTLEGQVLGTPAYMSPEQARGEAHAVDGRSDVYSLGVVLYRLLTGELPFRGNPRMLIHQLLHDEAKPPRALDDKIPRDLETITLKAMAKEPGRRYESARAMADDLRRYLQGEPIEARPVGRVERMWAWCRRNPTSAALGGVAAILVLTVAVVSSVGYLLTAEALDDADRARDATRNQLRETLIAQGRAERIAGSPWAAARAFAGAAQIKISDDLRQEAIQAVTSPGVRLSRSILFGRADLIGHADAIRLSDDGTLLAVRGNQQEARTSNPTSRQVIVVHRLADGVEVDRIEGPPGLTTLNSQSMRFRPGSSVLLFEDLGARAPVIRLRDVSQRKDLASFADATRAHFSPDGAWLALGYRDRIEVLDASSLRPGRSRAGSLGLGFLSGHELLCMDATRLVGWDVRLGQESLAFPLAPSVSWAGDEINGSIVTLIDARATPTVTMWDLKTGEEVARLDQVAPEGIGARHAAPGSVVALDLRGDRNEILLYDLVRRTSLGRVGGTVAPGSGRPLAEGRAMLSPNGRWLACAAGRGDDGRPGAILIWDVEAGQKLATLRDCAMPRWSADGRRLVTVAKGGAGTWQSDQGAVNIWEIADPVPMLKQSRPITALSTSAIWRQFATDALIWELKTDGSGGRPHLQALPSPRALQPFTSLTLVDSGVVYEARLPAPSSGFELPDTTPWLWQRTPHERALALSKPERVGSLVHVNVPHRIAISPDGRLAALSWRRWATTETKASEVAGVSRTLVGHLLDLWELNHVQKLREIQRDTQEVTKSPDADTTREAKRRQLGGLEEPERMVFSVDSRWLALACNGNVLIYDVSTGDPIRALGLIERPSPERVRRLQARCLSFSPDGRWIAFGGEEGNVRIGSVAPQRGEATVGLAAIAPIGSKSLVEAEPGVVCRGHSGTVLALAISPDGRTMASGGADRTIRLWEIPSGRPLACWQAHDADVSALVFDPEGSLLLSGAADGTLKLWDLPAIRHELSGLSLDW